MPKGKLDNLEQKKRDLEIELERIQHELDDSLHKVRSDVSTTFDPRRLVKDYPLPFIGAAIVLGFWVGKDKKKPSSEKKESKEKIYSPLLYAELKRLATKKILRLAGDYLEKMVERRSGNTASLQNGSVKKD